jgi:hypothetical protein
LYSKKEALGDTIKGLRKEISDIRKEIVDAVDVTKFIELNELFTVSVNTKRTDDDGSNVRVSFIITDKLNNTVIGRVEREIKTPKELYDKLTDKLTELSKSTKELSDVMIAIRDISRKERQVRARIVEKRLAESDLDHLLDDEDIIKLIE